MTESEDDLATWLLEQVAEDERIAREADAAAHWAVYLEGYAIESDAGDWFIEPKILARHLARHGPKPALAECEAKRRIIAEHSAVENGLGELVCVTCCTRTNDGDADGDWPCITLREYGAMYAKLGRPGYREEWAV